MSTGKTSSIITFQISNFTTRDAKQQKGGKQKGKGRNETGEDGMEERK